MDYISVKKLSEKYKIDFYQFISYLEYLKIQIKIENNVKCVLNKNVDLINKFISTYTTNQIAYMKSHNVQPFFNGILLLDLRKKYNLNEKQFKSKCINADLEFKYVYSNEECKQFDEFMKNISTFNRAELRDLKYIKEGWIPLRNIFNEFGEKYDFCENTGIAILKYLDIEIYNPIHQSAFLNKEQKEKFEEFLKKFNSSKERRLFFQEKTCQEKYGVSNPSHAEGARRKLSIKNTENAQERLKKAKQTNLEKYGVENYFQSENIIKYNSIKYKEIEEKIHNIGGILTKELAIYFNKDITTIVRILERLNIKKELERFYYTDNKGLEILKEYFDKTKYQSTSHQEKELTDFIKSIYKDEVIENTKSIISPMELDIYIPSKNLAIEFDGLYWHSELYKDNNYHLNKTKLCNSLGIDLIHVFEDDWIERTEIVKSIIATRLGVYKEKYMARKLNIYNINRKEAESFLNENHIQGFAQGTDYLELKNDNEIIQMVVINKIGFHDGNVELTRMATKLNTQVVGGFSKLVSHAYNIYRQPITSYINRACFNGKGYLSSGFKIVKENSPSYWWVNHNVRIHKSHFRKDKIKKLYENGIFKYYDENKSEFENMKNNGYVRLYDCGTIKVVYEK